MKLPGNLALGEVGDASATETVKALTRVEIEPNWARDRVRHAAGQALRRIQERGKPR